VSNFILGAIVGLLTGLLIAYWKQINFLYSNAGTIGDVSNVVQSGSNLLQKL
jgi:hypothetical protein